MRKVDIVVPVYKGLDETSACIDTVISSIDRELCNFIVINDCSPEPELTQYLRDVSVKHNFILVENDSNLGFTGTANRGMMYHTDTDVILLNSDVEVVNNWVERIKEVAYLSSDIATVTPFSNNATICSYPNFCEDNELAKGISVADIDHAFSSLVLDQKYVEIPTGVGFCMYMKREAITEVGLLDVETFGRGYGEENDWCQRAIKLGWKNVHALNTFVYHKGGVSFADEQNPRKENAMRLLNDLHPNYTLDVMNYIASDPAKYARQQAEISILSRSELPKILVVSHRLGGGVKHHIRQLEDIYSNEAKFIVLQPAKDPGIVELFISGMQKANSREFVLSLEEDKGTLRRILQLIGVSYIHYHHLLGFDFEIIKVLSDITPQYDITLHDYVCINGNPTLCDKDGKFISDEIAERDSKCAELYPIPYGWSIESWRSFINDWLVNARRVIFPSYDTYKRFIGYYPSLNQNSIVAWHPDKFTSNTVQLNFAYEAGKPLRVLILGALSREKGAEKLESVAKKLQGQNIEFHLLGYAFRPLDSAVICHGPYEHNSLQSKINAIAPDVCWFPAQWAETYSYTLSVALSYGLPIIAPDIGAFPERLDGRELTSIVPWDSSAEFFETLFKDIALKSTNAFPLTYSYPEKEQLVATLQNDFYERHYLADISSVANPLVRADAEFIHDFINKYEYQPSVAEANNTRTAKEKVLVFIWKLSQHQIVARLLKLIPFRLQRAIKRFLSNRSLYDIIK